MDWSGIEPETFRMRSERDTPTPPARRGCCKAVLGIFNNLNCFLFIKIHIYMNIFNS